MLAQETITTYHGTKEYNSGRCIYNLRLLSKLHLDAIDYRCAFQCNGANHSGESENSSEVSANPCNFYVDCEDYYKEVCALKCRAKRRRDLKMQLSDGDAKCLDCSGAESVECEHYMSVRYVVNEICGHKARVERKSRMKLPLIGLENNCAACFGERYLTTRCSKFYSMKDFHEFDVLFDLSRTQA